MIGMRSAVLSACVFLPAGDTLVASVPDGFQAVDDSLRFSLDGSRVAFVAEKSGRFHAVVGQEVGDAHQQVAPPTISSEGEHVFFRVMERDRKGEERWTLLRDGKKLAQGGWIGPLALSPAGVPAYWVFKDRKAKGGCVLTFGNKETKEWQTGDMDGAPRITADGKLALSVATRDEEWLMVTLTDKGAEQRQGAGVINAVAPHPDGKELLVTSMELEGGEWPRPGRPRRYLVQRMSLGERLPSALVSRSYRSAGSPVFSGDGRHFAYKVLGETGMGVALDDQQDAPTPFRFVDELGFSPDGHTLAYAACLEGALVFPATFGPESAAGLEVLEGVRAQPGKWVVVVGETRSAEYEQVRLPTWSADGQRVAFAARKAGAWRVVSGEQVSEPCDAVAAITWDGDRVRYGCRRGRELLWCELPAR